MEEADVDIVIVGAGILGINQLYRARQDGYSVRLLEQGDGVGGTWYWNRYPGCRFDSESYTYGYLFSAELWRDWEWSEEFAAQPETERYLNHVVDRFDLRDSIRFASLVVAADWDEESRTWTTRTEDGLVVRSTYLISTTGVLSVPLYPEAPGRETFAGEQYHTGRWPKAPVDVAGKRVAVIGTGSSGVQVAPLIADEAVSLTIYQRTPSSVHPARTTARSPQRGRPSSRAASRRFATPWRCRSRDSCTSAPTARPSTTRRSCAGSSTRPSGTVPDSPR